MAKTYFGQQFWTSFFWPRVHAPNKREIRQELKNRQKKSQKKIILFYAYEKNFKFITAKNKMGSNFLTKPFISDNINNIFF